MITVENACMISIIFAEVLIIVNEVLKKAGDNRKNTVKKTTDKEQEDYNNG